MNAANAVTQPAQTLTTKKTMQGQQSTTSRSEERESAVMNVQIADELKAAPLQEQVVVNALQARANGPIADATVDFAEEFRFKDYGIGLEFNDTNSSLEFFQKARELYPDSSVQIGHIFVSGNYVIAEWMLQDTMSQSFYGGLMRKVTVSLHGISVLRTENGKITEWTDYYDGLTAQRTALVSYFTEWVEL
jgi:ketosteroid isomerase-like protein